jgi:hypothetical protein
MNNRELVSEKCERRSTAEADAQRLRKEGKVPEVEMRYGDLMRAIRTTRDGRSDRLPGLG